MKMMCKRVCLILVVFAADCVGMGHERGEVTDPRTLATKGRWVTYEGNPVLDLGADGQWDCGTLATMSVLKVGDTYHMYYEAGFKGVEDYQNGHAVSKDCIHWKKDPANPVIPFGARGEWDEAETWDPFVLYEDGLFKMWYGGTAVREGKRDFQIGYATSRDGTHFTQRRQISHYERGNVGDMHVVHDTQSGKYFMYYLDRSHKPKAVFRAESPNETDFDFDNADRIDVEGEETDYRCPHVFIDEGLWYMYYGFKYEKRAGYATSSDGLHFKAQNIAVIEGDDPEILKIADDLYLLFYCPTEYHMGHELGCDIRVAVFEGKLHELASTERTGLNTAVASLDLQKEFSAWRDGVVQWREAKLVEPDLPNEMTFDNIMPTPDNPELWPLWRDWLAQWREDQRKILNYDDKYYRAPAFAWIPSNLVSTKIMSWDMYFIDPETGRYTVDKFLEHGEREYGGYDNVLLWQAYPRIGIDERNQFDFYRDLPGGLDGLREVVEACHAKGVKVFISYNPWDRGTRREGRFEEDVAKFVLTKMDEDLLMETVKAINADGIYLDTWFCGPALRVALDNLGPGLALQTELAVAMKDVATHHMSWGQSKPWKTWLFKDSHAPGVVRNKWFERRHVVYPTNRWIDDRTGNLQTSWMNGTGTLVWENRFGAWDGWSPRDRSMLRSMIPIQRRYIELFAGEGWIPLVAKQGDSVFASLWEGGDLRLWTLINRADKTYDGELLSVSHQRGTRYFDLIRGTEAQVKIKEGLAHLNGPIDGKGIAGLMAVPEGAVTNDFNQFLKRQADIFSHRDGDTNYPEGKGFVKPVTPTRKVNKNSLPPAMAAIDAVKVTIKMKLSDRGRPADFYWKTPREKEVDLSAYAIDLTPVTNAQYAEFLTRSGYRPRHKENFLKHWIDGKIPAGKEDHPVVYVDLDDARAYAKWAGKRLPTQEEWQYAAEGPEHLKYPWGDDMKANVCNNGESRGTTSVHAFPEGRSPFGCYDMCGNTWEWTQSERSNEGRTRFCYIRGGSYYEAKGSGWYTDDGPQPCNRPTKFLLVWPGLDRCSTIGFRCVVDLKG